MGIGIKLSELMKQRGTNVNELAQKVGVAPTTIYSMVKRDSKKADIGLLVRIAQELGVTAEYFSDETFEKHEPSYDNLKNLIARNGKAMSSEEKLELIRMLSDL